MDQLSALLDANVLYSVQSRDILLQLARDSFFEVRWSLAIQNELRKSLGHKAPHVSDAQLERLLSTMNNSFPDALAAGFEDLVESLNLPDADDRHVLAAAIFGGCNLLVTHNIRHFPHEYIRTFGLRVYRPDDFLAALLLSNPRRFCAFVSRVLSRLRNPAYTFDQYVSQFLQNGLVQTSAILQRYRHHVT